MLRRLLAALDVRPGEGRLVLLLFIHSFFLGVPRILTSTAAMALFLTHLDARHLPYVYVAAAVAIPLAGFARLRLAGRLSFRTLLMADLGFVFLTLAALRLLLWMPDSFWVSVMLPVWYEVEWVLLSLEFWGLAGNLLNVRQGKRLFGLIGAGELAAGGIVGLAVPPIVTRVGTADLLVFSLVAVACCFVMLLVVTEVFPLHAGRGTASEQKAAREGRYGDLRRNRYLTLLFALVTLSYVGYYFVDNAFYAVARARHADGDKLAAFLGVFWGIASLITLASRAFVSGRVLIRYGLVGGLLALPAALAVGASTVAVSGAVAGTAVALLWPMALTKLLDQVLRDSLDRSAVLVLYQPLPAAQRVRAQTAVEGIVGPIAGGLSGLALLLLVQALRFETVHLAALLLLVVGGWTAVALATRREYTDVLAKNLRSGRLAGVPLALADASSFAVLLKGLRSPHAGEVLYALSALEDVRHPALADLLAELLGHTAPDVRREVLMRIERLGIGGTRDEVRRLARADADPRVRGAALRALAAVGDGPDVESLENLSADPELEVRTGALVGALRHGGLDGVRRAGEVLVQQAASSDPRARTFAARVIGEVGGPSFVRPLLALLKDLDAGVRRAALQGASRLGDARLWPPVLEGLRDPAVRSAAMSALLAGGESVLGPLEAAYADAGKAGDRASQRRIARLVGQIGGPSSAHMLWSWTDAPAPDVRLSVLTALALCGHRADGRQKAAVDRRVRREAAEAAASLAALDDLGGAPTAELLAHALAQEIDRSRERIFCLLSLSLPSDAVQRARANLESRLPEQRARAVELVDSLLTQDLAEVFVPLIEEASSSARLAHLRPHFAQHALGRQQRLRRLIASGGSPWIRACALHAAAEEGLEGLAEPVAAAREDTDTLVREEAARAFGRLGRNPRVESGDGKSGQGVGMPSTIETVLVLKSVSVFAETPDEILAELASVLEESEVSTGETIFQKGEMGSALYIVVEGRVRVHLDDRTLVELGPRDIFGEMAALDPEPRSASVTALEPTRLFRLEQEALYEVMADRIEVARGVIRVLCRRLRAWTA